MSQKLYIGNLPYRTTENDVRNYFSKFEPILSVVLISDRETGRSRGFGFIELEDMHVDAAILELSDTMFGGRNLRISKARDRGEGSQQATQRVAPQYNRV
jgi:RNA recognition motif-containing protein